MKKTFKVLLSTIPLLLLLGVVPCSARDFTPVVNNGFVAFRPEFSSEQDGNVLVYVSSSVDGTYILAKNLPLETHLKGFYLDEVFSRSSFPNTEYWITITVYSGYDDKNYESGFPVLVYPYGYNAPVITFPRETLPVIPSIDSYPVEQVFPGDERSSLNVLSSLQYSSIWSFFAVGVSIVGSFVVLGLIYNKVN